MISNESEVRKHRVHTFPSRERFHLDDNPSEIAVGLDERIDFGGERFEISLL